MPIRREQLSVVSGDRVFVRRQVILKFLDEIAGTGKGDLCSKYVYEVEILQNGGKILLKRPAALNKGVDFTVHIEGARFRDRGMVDMPSHSDIFDDLSAKRSSNPIEYEKVRVLIRKIYSCEDIAIEEYESLLFSIGLPIEATLKSIKWLFVEQDVTYWNWSGRSMLYFGLQDRALC
jgi:hypothetical protein